MSLFWLKVAQNAAGFLWYLMVSIGRRLALIVNRAFSSLFSTFFTNSLANVKGSIPPAEHQAPTFTEPDPSQLTVLESRPPYLFALLIGIDKYKDPAVHDLCGAVNDAVAVENFLTMDAGVPKNRIVNLLNEGATREAIVNAIRDLAHNSAISVHDPILIYYAGHGSEASSPIGWGTSTANGPIQMLLPHDFILKGSDDVQGQGIFNMVLSQIFVDIAMVKSDNITVITDCCYSGHGTGMSLTDPAHSVRGIQLPLNYTIPANLLPLELCNGSSTSETFKETNMSSYVLLAACGPGQLAIERHGHGAFTRELLNLFKQKRIQEFTCADVIMHLPYIPFQNPQCKGVNQHRKFLDLKLQRLVAIYPIYPMPGNITEFTLQAGEAHGVVNGARFAVYSDQTLSNPLGSVVAFGVTPFTSQCSTSGGAPFALSHSAHAVQTHAGKRHDLCLLIHRDDPSHSRLVQLIKGIQANTNRCSIRLVEYDDEEPDLVISTRGELVQFEVKDMICRQHGFTHMPFNDVRVDEPEYLHSILLSAADFYWYLRHSREDSSLTSMVNVECLKLEGTGQLTDDLDEILVPEPSGQNLNINGTIFIDVGDLAEPYGYKITSNFDVPLYVALFYFDASDLSIGDGCNTYSSEINIDPKHFIVEYYLPRGTTTDDQPEFSLAPKGFLTIGLGDNGYPPRTYYLREGQSVDVGFLKIYVSTTFVDYTSIIHQTPFRSMGTRGNGDSTRHREIWDALTIPIIQRRISPS